VKKISGNWKSVLKADPTNWLLENDNPSVRYFTLKDILERKENDPDVQDARKSIMTMGIVPAFWKNRTATAAGRAGGFLPWRQI